MTEQTTASTASHYPARTWVLLEIGDAAQFAREIVGLQISERQMRRYADQQRLPFAHGFDGRRRISEQALLEALTAPQQRALESWRKDRSPRRRR